jgi:hypothetical protein
MRREPREQSEMVSQLLFGEYYRVIARSDRWIQILTRFDSYTGWIDRKLFHEASDAEYHAEDSRTTALVKSLLAEIESPGFPRMFIPAGSELPGYDAKSQVFIAGGRPFHIRNLIGQYSDSYGEPSRTAMQFLNAPYLWGGRSLLGIDCSGFVQLVYKILGIPLMRDTSQQVLQGVLVKSVSEAAEGDLAFFSNDQGSVAHVGMMLSPGTIIHCSGHVRIDKLDSTGILTPLKEYSHKNLMIRRVLA